MTQRRNDRHERHLRMLAGDLPNGAKRRARNKRRAKGHRRNALVALGNAGGPDARTRAAVDRYADGDDEMLAENARWARARGCWRSSFRGVCGRSASPRAARRRS